MRRPAPYKRHTTVCRLVVAQFRAMSLLFSCCSSADNSRLFLPLFDMRSQAAVRSKFFPVLLWPRVFRSAPRALPGPQAGRIDFDRKAETPRHLGRDYGGAGSAE